MLHHETLLVREFPPLAFLVRNAISSFYKRGLKGGEKGARSASY